MGTTRINQGSRSGVSLWGRWCRSRGCFKAVTGVLPFVATSLGSIPVNAQSCAELSPGAISWWSGDGDARDILSGLDGTLGNGATFAPGLVDEAFSLDGVNDFVSIPHHALLVPQRNAISVEAWIRPEGTLGGTVLSKYNSNANARAWVLLVLSKGNVRWGVYNDNTNDARVVDTVDADGTLVQLGVFHHVAGTFDGRTQSMKTYVNGRAVGHSFVLDDPVVLANTTANVRIGGFVNASGSLTSNFRGLIDEPTVYDRVLTSGEIRAIYRAGMRGKCAAELGRLLGDCDGDCTVGLDDYGGFASCLGGPGDALTDSCVCFDSDFDNDADLRDFSVFDAHFGDRCPAP